MADRRGGYRQPRNPAPASGPGKLSRRTDGGPGQKLMAPTGMDYGAHQALMAQERSAAMSQTDSTPSLDIPQQQAPAAGTAASTLPFLRPTERPDEPVTHGVDIGPGAGSEVLPVEAQPNFQQRGPMSQLLSQFAARDMTGAMARLYQSADALGA